MTFHNWFKWHCIFFLGKINSDFPAPFYLKYCFCFLLSSNRPLTFFFFCLALCGLRNLSFLAQARAQGLASTGPRPHLLGAPRFTHFTSDGSPGNGLPWVDAEKRLWTDKFQSVSSCLSLSSEFELLLLFFIIQQSSKGFLFKSPLFLTFLLKVWVFP